MKGEQFSQYYHCIVNDNTSVIQPNKLNTNLEKIMIVLNILNPLHNIKTKMEYLIYIFMSQEKRDFIMQRKCIKVF